MAELGASLETYSELLPKLQTLRLCYRFGNGPLSVMPQEILDLIIKALYRSVRKETLPRWNSQFMCFQGRCSRSQHVLFESDDEVEELWRCCFSNTEGCCARHQRDEDLESDDYDIEEKREMVAECIDDDGSLFAEQIWEEHDEARDRWLAMVCLCKDTGRSTDKKTFTHLQKVRCTFKLLAISPRKVC
jgi:hypothetical protein